MSTPPDLQALLRQHGERIRRDNLGRPAVQRLTGLGDSASRRLLLLVRGELSPEAAMAMKSGSNTRARRKISQELPGQTPPRTKALKAPAEPQIADQIKSDEEGDTLKVESKGRISTPEELLARAGIDERVWMVERVKLNNWEMGSTPRRTGNDKEGWTRPSDKVNVTPLYAIQIWLKRRTDVLDLLALKQETLEEIRQAAPAPVVLPRRRTKLENLLYLGAHDVHVGAFAAVEETRQAYTTELAIKLAQESIARLLQKASGAGIDRILLPVGHDLTHFENPQFTTSAGTQQDPDGRYRLMRRCAYELMVRLIEQALEVAPVDIEAVPGNHGRETDLGIAERLEARFHNHPHVHVRASLHPRPYYVYGTNLLGLTHGDRVRPESLPLIMADEMPQAWAETTVREWLMGHYHAKKVYQVMQTETESRGVRMRYLPSIKATDYYHAVCGYGNVRAMEAYLYHVSEGYSGHYSVNVRNLQ